MSGRRASFLSGLSLLVLALLAGPPPVGAVGATEEAGEILRKADAIRNPQQSFIVDVGLTAYEAGRRTDRTRVTTHSRKDGSGQFLTLVHIDEPVRDRSKLLLRNGNLLWFYDPAAKTSVRLSPRQRLLGNASNGDVVTANLALDYSVELKGETEVKDGEKRVRRVYRLELTSRDEITPYDRIELWVDQASYQPIKGQFYTKSGRLLKVAWYRGYEEILGELRPTEVVIADGFDPKSVTVMKMSNYRAQDLPQSWFSNGWLPRFRKQ